MCQPKYWNKIYIKQTENHAHRSIIIIYAERSDLEEIEVIVEIEMGDSRPKIVDTIRDAINSLESYRDCDCTAKFGSCIKHLNDVAIQITNNFSRPKSAVTFGRR